MPDCSGEVSEIGDDPGGNDAGDRGRAPSFHGAHAHPPGCRRCHDIAREAQGNGVDNGQLDTGPHATAAKPGAVILNFVRRGLPTHRAEGAPEEHPVMHAGDNRAGDSPCLEPAVLGLNVTAAFERD